MWYLLLAQACPKMPCIYSSIVLFLNNAGTANCSCGCPNPFPSGYVPSCSCLGSCCSAKFTHYSIWGIWLWKSKVLKLWNWAHHSSSSQGTDFLTISKLLYDITWNVFLCDGHARQWCNISSISTPRFWNVRILSVCFEKPLLAFLVCCLHMCWLNLFNV